MMLSEFDANGNHDRSSKNSQLLHDIEAISKALYLDKTPHKDLISPSRLVEPKANFNAIIRDEPVCKDKKSSSLWSWKKPLKALTHIRHQKFNVCFFLHVHSIEGLPPSFNDICLCVHWKRKNELLQTSASRVSKGTAEFDETLMHKCSIYGSRSGPHHSAKYEEKLFLIYAAVFGAPGIDMGKHWIDLTRLLPLTLEELQREKSFGKWSTSFKLSGRANGAILNISFGYSILGDSLIEARSNMNASELVNLAYYRPCTLETRTSFETTSNTNNASLKRVGSVPSDLNRASTLGSQPIDVKICDDVSANLGLELSKSINFLYQKLNEVKLHGSQELGIFSEHSPPKTKPGMEFDSDKDSIGNEYDNIDFTVIDKGIEISRRELLESDQNAFQTLDTLAIEVINADEIISDEDPVLDEEIKMHLKDGNFDTYVDKVLVDDCKHEEKILYNKESTMDNLESTFSRLLVSESTESASPPDVVEISQEEQYMETKSDHYAKNVLKKSRSLDDATESVARDFLNMLGIEHSPYYPHLESDPESPRERLLREFEKEVLASGNIFVDYDAGEYEGFGCIGPSGSNCEDLHEDFDFDLSLPCGVEEEHQGTSDLLRRRKAKVLEDLETEALMREWGINEMAFQSSPRCCSDGFGSPVELLPENSVELPPLGDGFGSFIQTKDGGCLRSMNPSLFRGSKNVGPLIIQVSQPVVLPAELGYDTLEILQHLALVGIDKLLLQLNDLISLEDVTGKTLQQLADDAALGATVSNRQATCDADSMFEPDTVGDQRKEVGGFSSGWFFKNMKSSPFGSEMDLGYVSLEYLAPLMLDKIEAISLEGMRIQSGMSEQKAPSSISPQSIENILGNERKSANLHEIFSRDRDAVQLYDERDSGRYATGLLGLSITLDEWIRLDAGIIGGRDQLSDHSMMTLAAHHAKCIDSVNGRLTRDINLDNASDEKKGLLGDKITLAFRVLHRDPLRNYEAVGASMLALIQMERAFFYPKPIVCSTLLEKDSHEELDHELSTKEGTSDARREGEMKGESCTWFKITEFHLSGLNTEPGRIPQWCTKMQQQSGTRWLVANGMSKSYENTFSKSKAMVVSYPEMAKIVQSRATMWSLSSRASDMETQWNELAGSVSHIRNPDIVFPK